VKIILGAVVSVQPFSAGMAWNWMQLATGLRRLGHKVYYFEQVEPHWCVDKRGERCSLSESINYRTFRRVTQRFDLEDSAFQIDMNERTADGTSLNEILRKIDRADLLINMSGHIKSEAILGAAERRAYVDQDPVYTQLWNAEYGKDLAFAAHDAFFTVGLNIGTNKTPIPDCGLQWHPLVPVIAPDDWPEFHNSAPARFTTVASWTGYKSIAHDGEWYGSKYEEFMRFALLPEHVEQDFEVAMRRYRDEEDGIELLRSHDWQIVDSSGLFDLDSYQVYISRSRAEIGIAKNAYVKSHSGWFSDRSAHYLASGRPVLAQATGYEDHFPTGRGLLHFSNMDEAVAGVEEINRNYASHCNAAREIAAEFLSYRKVIPSLIDDAFATDAAVAMDG